MSNLDGLLVLRALRPLEAGAVEHLGPVLEQHLIAHAHRRRGRERRSQLRQRQSHETVLAHGRYRSIMAAAEDVPLHNIAGVTAVA